jgi:hypothetical protein
MRYRIVTQAICRRRDFARPGISGRQLFRVTSLHRIVDGVGPGTDGLPCDDRCRAPGKQRNIRGRIILRIELAVVGVEQPATAG